jgi:hypothetical protein
MKISVGDVKATIEMVRQRLWGPTLEGKDLSIEQGLHFMRRDLYPQV